MIKYREKETITYEKIIIAMLYNLYKEKRALVIKDEELTSATDIKMLSDYLDSFIGITTYNLSEKDKEIFLKNCTYLTYSNGELILKEQISENYIDYLAHSLDYDLLCLLREATYKSLQKKYIETIYYKEQVLCAFYTLLKNYGIKSITSEELRCYRIKLAEYLAARNERMILEANKESIENFRQVYRFDIETIFKDQELIYILREDLTLSELESLVLNNVDNSYKIDLLTNKEIIDSSFNEVKKLKLSKSN